MTAQIPERFLIDGKPYLLHTDPLEPLLKGSRLKIIAPEGWTTACHRQYIGTWRIDDGRLMLVTLSTYGRDEYPLPEYIQPKFFKRAGAKTFPIPAHWFSGTLRIPVGPRLIRGFHGWSNWYTRERVITCRKGEVIREREVDTLSMLVWALRRFEYLRQNLDPNDTPGGPAAWISEEHGDLDHLRQDWWPPEWPMAS